MAENGWESGASDAPGRRPPRVGVFDSGVGGLSVVTDLRRRIPGADVLYVADSGFAPYGRMPREEIRRRCMHIAATLVREGCDILVVACNTATAAAIEVLRAEFPLPIVGMEPAVKPATAATRSGVVGVLATDGTLASARFAALLDRFADNVTVLVAPAPELVELAEAGVTSGSAVDAIATRKLAPLVDAGADTLVLGCTHFPWFRASLARAAPAMTLIDTGDAVAVETRRRLLENGPSADGALTGSRGGLRVLTSGDRDRVASVIARLLDRTVSVESVPQSAEPGAV